MADKKHNINIGGDNIQIPAWASDVTAEAMVLMSQRTNILLDDMLGGVKGLKEVDDKTLAAIKKTLEGVDENASSDAAAARDRAEMVLAGATHVKNVANFFGDSEKPLTGMVNAMERMTESLTGPGAAGNKKSAMNKLFGKFPGFGALMGKWGKAVGATADIIFTAAGWNAAKFEQFAEVQRKMIDNGAIFYESGDTFDDLYAASFKAGVTYNAFADTVSNFGTTMTALGGDVSQGSKKFLGLFKSLQDSTDSMGDLGMQNKEMMESYAGYIEAIRLSGRMDGMLANNGEMLEASFQSLVVESTALASLTSLNRSEAMAAYTTAMSDPFMAAAQKKLKERGLHKTADISKEFAQTIKLLSANDSELTPMLEQIYSAFSESLFNMAGGGKEFNMEALLYRENENLPAMIKTILGKDVLENWQALINDGEAAPGEVSEMIRNQILNADTKTGFINAGAQVDGMVDTFYKGQMGVIQIIQDMGAWLKLGKNEFETKVNETYGKLDESGTTVEAMNDMSKAFLSAQELLTMDINGLATTVKAVTGVLRKGATAISNTSGDLLDMFMSDELIVTEEDKITGTNAPPPGHPEWIAANSETNKLATVSTTPTVTGLTEKVDIINKKLYNSGNGSNVLSDQALKLLNDRKKLLELQIKALTTSIQAKENEIAAKNRTVATAGYN